MVFGNWGRVHEPTPPHLELETVTFDKARYELAITDVVTEALG